MTVHRMSDAEEKVKDALNVWAKSMEDDNAYEQLGYGRCVGFVSGGSVSGWEDFERRCDKTMAENVAGIYSGLTQPQQMAIDHFHLSAVWKPQRYKIEDVYTEALIAIEIALRRRGLI